MASTFFLLLFFISLEEVLSNSFVKVDCKTQTIGLNGHQTLLNCVVSTSEEVIDAEIQTVVWAKVGDTGNILTFEDGKSTPSSSRFSFAVPSWNNKNMNVSLLISETSPKDEGDYRCRVYTDSGDNVEQISLKVTAKYSEPTFESDPGTLDLNTGGSLTCKSSGYPEGRLRWFDKDKEWTRNPETKSEETESGLFSLSSTMTVAPQSVFSKYTCKVFNARGELEAENSYEVKDAPSSGGLGSGNSSDASTIASKVVTPVVVIGSLIVGLLLCLLLMHRRRARQARRHSATPLISERQDPSPTYESDDFRDEPPVEDEPAEEKEHDSVYKRTGNP